MGLIRFLIIAICSLYIIRALARMFLPMLFQSVIRKAQEQQNGAQQNYQQQQPRPDGRVKVDYMPEGKKSQVPDTEGEFVEYEEIKSK
jgi:hypothetical protein